METLTSHQPIATYSPTLNHRINEISPAKRVFLTQHLLMRILRRRARSEPLITMRYNCGVVELTQSETGVYAKTADGEISAQYCVRCDGTSSTLRQAPSGDEDPNIRTQLNKSLTIVFRVQSPESCADTGGHPTILQ
jgi:2-polyprenyl-6-methoxyphenol hydroxylase-like FAD-dependent oxidoreductase